MVKFVRERRVLLPCRKIKEIPIFLEFWGMWTFQHSRQEGNSAFWTQEIQDGLPSVTALFGFMVEIGLEWKF